MSESTFENDTGKTRGQDALGLALAGLGAFFAVSILQALRGKHAEFFLAQPVEGLMTVLGPWIGLFVAGATTAVGVMLFLSLEAKPVGRPLVGIVAASMGIAIAVGGLIEGGGGAVGAILPSAMGGLGGLIAGLVIGISICLASIWITWAGVAVRTEPKPGSEGGLMARTNAIDGVSPAEALALQTKTEPESEHAGGVFADISPEGFAPAPVRALSPDETLQSTARQAQRKAAESLARAGAAPPRHAEPAGADLVAPVRSPDPPLADERAHAELVVEPEPAEAASLNGLARAGLPENTVPAPSWESPAAETHAEVEDQDDWEQVGLFDEEEVPAALPVTEPIASAGDEVEEDGAFEQAEFEPGPELEQAAELEEAEEEEDEEEEYEEEEEEDEEAAEYEEEEEEEDEEEAAEYEEDEEEEYEDEDEDEDEEEEYEDEEEEDEEAAELEDDEEDEEEEEEEDASEAEYLIAPPEERAESTPAKKAAALPSAGPGSLLFQAGNLIVAENRVAVSMIQRRFELDFDQACDVLDRLQSEGLIGPYIGGRTREILLSAEEWEEKAASLTV